MTAAGSHLERASRCSPIPGPTTASAAKAANRSEARSGSLPSASDFPRQISSCFGTRVRHREPAFVTSATSSIRTPPRPR